MSWAKVDDGWWCHAKVMGLSLAARGLWVSALSWSCAQREPVIPPMFLRLCGAEEVHAEELADAGLWHPTGEGWEIHDWSEYQEQSLSEKRAEAGRKGGRAKARKSSDQGERKQTPSKPDLPEVANGLAGTHPFPTRPVHTDPPHSSENHSDRDPEPVAELREQQPVVDEQAVRRTANLVGRAVAAGQVGVANPTGYAAKVTRDILAAPDGLDRQRIERLLTEGATPEAIADAWHVDPFGLGSSTAADPGPDLKKLYIDRQKATEEQFAEQRRDPPEMTAASRASARAALRGGVVEVAS